MENLCLLSMQSFGHLMNTNLPVLGSSSSSSPGSLSGQDLAFFLCFSFRFSNGGNALFFLDFLSFLLLCSVVDGVLISTEIMSSFPPCWSRDSLRSCVFWSRDGSCDSLRVCWVREGLSSVAWRLWREFVLFFDLDLLGDLSVIHCLESGTKWWNELLINIFQLADYADYCFDSSFNKLPVKFNRSFIISNLNISDICHFIICNMSISMTRRIWWRNTCVSVVWFVNTVCCNGPCYQNKTTMLHYNFRSS